MTSSFDRKLRGPAVAILSLLILTAVGSCATPADDSAGNRQASDVSAAAAFETTSSGSHEPQDPLASALSTSISRASGTGGVRLKPSAGKLSPNSTIRYSDGVVIRMVRVTQGAEKGQGPGVLPGRSYMAFSFAIENHAGGALDVSNVVVSATYGSPSRLASPVYDDDLGQDFSGQALPASIKTATYKFAIPNDQRSTLNLNVDLDATHDPAQFTGGLR